MLLFLLWSRPLVKTHFPKDNPLHKLFNKNNVKVSYCTSRNMGTIIKDHNKQLLRNKQQEPTKLCNCRKKDECPLSGKCLASSIVYKATVTTSDDTKHYIGLTDTTFKTRYTNHKHTFKAPKHRNSTELSKFIWNLKDNNTPYNIKWSIIDRAPPYSTKTKRCHLCTTEKFHIIYSDRKSTLNKRTEFLSKCRHSSKFLLIYNWAHVTTATPFTYPPAPTYINNRNPTISSLLKIAKRMKQPVE